MFDERIKTKLMEELQFGTGIQGLIIALVILGLIWVIGYYDQKYSIERLHYSMVMNVYLTNDGWLYTVSDYEYGYLIDIESKKRLIKGQYTSYARHEGKLTGYTYKIEIID